MSKFRSNLLEQIKDLDAESNNLVNRLEYYQASKLALENVIDRLQSPTASSNTVQNIRINWTGKPDNHPDLSVYTAINCHYTNNTTHTQFGIKTSNTSNTIFGINISVVIPTLYIIYLDRFFRIEITTRTENSRDVYDFKIIGLGGNTSINNITYNDQLGRYDVNIFYDNIIRLIALRVFRIKWASESFKFDSIDNTSVKYFNGQNYSYVFDNRNRVSYGQSFTLTFKPPNFTSLMYHKIHLYIEFTTNFNFKFRWNDSTFTTNTLDYSGGFNSFDNFNQIRQLTVDDTKISNLYNSVLHVYAKLYHFFANYNFNHRVVLKPTTDTVLKQISEIDKNREAIITISKTYNGYRIKIETRFHSTTSLRDDVTYYIYKNNKNTWEEIKGTKDIIGDYTSLYITDDVL